jgi:hypothetical protein
MSFSIWLSRSFSSLLFSSLIYLPFESAWPVLDRDPADAITPVPGTSVVPIRMSMIGRCTAGVLRLEDPDNEPVLAPASTGDSQLFDTTNYYLLVGSGAPWDNPVTD